MNNKDLETLRAQINNIDNNIIELLEKRSEIVKEIGKIKREKGLSFYAPERENQIYKTLDSLKLTYMNKNSLKAIFREIMSASIKMEEPLTISYLGPEATFTHQAAIEKFGTSLYYQSEESIEDVFFDVEQDRADFGVVPIENSIEGVVNYT
ncbi:chorismate mutase, partial [Desulfurella sp.]